MIPIPPPTPACPLASLIGRISRTASFFVVCAAFLISVSARAAEAASVAGTVSNAQTGNLLEGVRIEIPALRRSTLTDNSGRYVLSNIPAGTHEIVATYIGLDPMKTQVVVGGGQRIVENFDLTSGIYKLEAFKVTGEREGNAAMITEKRNADNVKDIIAMDSFGYLPNMSAGEVVMRLPGVAGSPTDEGLAYRFNMRGMDPALNNVTVDGGSLTTLGTNRSFELQSITGAMFEALELVKGHTPDKGADSLGGTINFKTRSTFSMKERHRTTYNFSTRWAPPFLEQTPIRSQHRAHPILNVTHQQVFDVFGEQRNLGVSLNLFYSENAVGGWETVFDRTNLLNGPAPVFSYQTWDNTNNRKQMSVNLKADYRWSPTTKFSLGFTENDNFERHRRRVRVTAVTGGNTTTPGTSGLRYGRPAVCLRHEQQRREHRRPDGWPAQLLCADGPARFQRRTQLPELADRIHGGHCPNPPQQRSGPRRPAQYAPLRPGDAAGRQPGGVRWRRVDSRPVSGHHPPAFPSERRCGLHQPQQLPPAPQRRPFAAAQRE
jgi:outer membrane receptor protein involved in Fe transport